MGVVEGSSVPKDRLFKEPLWQNHPRLVRLPLDAMTLGAFLRMDTAPLSDADRQRFEKAARMAHEDYIKSARPKDPSLQDWENLDESLKLSNYCQVAYWEGVLKEYNLGVRKLTRKDRKCSPLNLTKVVGEKGIRRLAEMEHGRWNVERLSYGWHHAEEKDVARKLNPCLVPWPKLRNINGTDYQPYDINAIRGLPQKLREAGLELYRI